MGSEQEIARLAGTSQCTYYLQLGELLPIVREVEQGKGGYKDVLALYDWCSKQSDMQYVEISSYVMRALEIICGQADQQGAELKDEALFRLIRKFREIRWITRTDLMNVRLQQLIERL